MIYCRWWPEIWSFGSGNDSRLICNTRIFTDIFLKVRQEERLLQEIAGQRVKIHLLECDKNVWDK